MVAPAKSLESQDEGFARNNNIRETAAPANKNCNINNNAHNKVAEQWGKEAPD